MSTSTDTDAAPKRTIWVSRYGRTESFFLEDAQDVQKLIRDLQKAAGPDVSPLVAVPVRSLLTNGRVTVLVNAQQDSVRFGFDGDVAGFHS